MDDTGPTELLEAASRVQQHHSDTCWTRRARQPQSAAPVIHHLTQTLSNVLPRISVHIHSSGHIYVNKWLVKRQMRTPIKSPYYF